MLPSNPPGRQGWMRRQAWRPPAEPESITVKGKVAASSDYLFRLDDCTQSPLQTHGYTYIAEPAIAADDAHVLEELAEIVPDE